MSKILIADDDTSVRKLCYEVFTSSGHEVVTVPRGQEMIDLLVQEKPDIVLLDIQMPGESGLSILRRMPVIKGRRVPVIIFSGCVTAEIEKQAYDAGAVEVILKGIDIVELRQKVEKILSLKHEIFGEPADFHKLGKSKILIVDDEENIRTLLIEFFEQKGFNVLAARNGEEALRLVEKEKPSSVLVDITMKGMDGMIILKKIKEINPEIGVVMATAVQDEQIAREATSLGAYAYVLKPFDLQYLELVVMTRLMIAS